MAASTAYDQYPIIHNSAQAGSSSASAGPSFCVTGAGVDAISATTKYLANPGENHAAAQIKLYLATRAVTIQNLYCSMETAPAGTDTSIFTVQTSVDNGANWVDSTLTVTITGTAKSGSDVTHRVAVAAGTLLAIKEVATGSTGAKCVASFEVG